MATILLVEDEPDLRRLVAFNLGRQGYRVVEAKDGIEALDRLEETPVDMIVADMMMPRMDGLELCARVQERPALAEVPFLFVTAKDGAEAQYLGLRAGADDYISKPFEVPDLLARVRGRLDQRARKRPKSEPKAPLRWCPVCAARMHDPVCPDHGVETLPVAKSASPADVAPGTVIGDRFLVEQPLGQGAMAHVYLARQLSIGRPVALKLLHFQGGWDDNEILRFHREARSVASLQHPNLVQVIDFGVDSATSMPFLAMALVEGQTLRTVASGRPLSVSLTASLLAQVADGLAAAHSAGVVHRDLKPENIMVKQEPDGRLRVVLLDFGVAKLPAGIAATATLTGRGQLVGTPQSMSPEQVRGDAVGAATDLYALGCLLYELLLGQPPFSADNAAGLLFEHLHTEAPMLPERTPSGEPVPESMRSLLAQLLAKNPAERPSDAVAVARTLRELEDSLPQTLPPPAVSVSQDLADGVADTRIRPAPLLLWVRRLLPWGAAAAGFVALLASFFRR